MGPEPEGLTVIYPSRILVDDPIAELAVSFTVYVPAFWYVCEGFAINPSVVPSPKSHAHMVGLPVDVSVNWTVSGAVPDVGVAVKFATMPPDWVTVMYPSFVLVLEPPVAELAVSFTVYVPAFWYVCEGFAIIPSVVPSPKSHAHMVGLPVDVSVNWTVSGAVPDVGVAVKSATMPPDWVTVM
ncbi:MAG: hypothetical protein BWY45_01258 [Euryarchaeota archaeon ADurb.Bin294]|nr:MAG: hypothetical protein BWY45_01258 [Euryarchaeota archaeon ADurb.Bin294]